MVKGKFGQTSKSLTMYGHGCRSFHICYTCLNNYFNNIRCQACQRSVQVYHELSCITVLLPSFGVQLAMKCQLSFPFAKFKSHYAWLYVFITSSTRFSVNPLYLCLNVKELLARNRRHIWSLSDWNGIRTHNDLECGFTLKRVRDMMKTYSQMHRTDKDSQHSSII